MLEDNDYIGDLGDHAHQHADVWVTQDALHDDFILDLFQERICYIGIENFLYRYGGSIAETCVNHGETTLSYLLTNV